MINRAIITGRITKDLELRKTQTGISFVRFTVAVNRAFTNKNSGEREADFIQVIAWRGLADNLCKFMGKGSLVGIDGAIRTGSYDNSEGKRVYTTEIQADNIQFLEGKKNNESQGGYGGQPQYNQPSYNQQGYSNQQQPYNPPANNHGFGGGPVNDNPFANNKGPIEVEESDLPF